MVGRLDDWLKVAAEKENITIDPGYLELAGIAVFKKTYQLFRKRGYRIRLLSAAFRNHLAHYPVQLSSDFKFSEGFIEEETCGCSDATWTACGPGLVS
jgi:transaldolase